MGIFFKPPKRILIRQNVEDAGAVVVTGIFQMYIGQFI